MQRDVDLARQLLFDIESRGAECSFGPPHTTANGEAIRNGVNGHATDEQLDQLRGYPSESVRHHLRLLIDAGFVKETERSAAGALCVRLTHAGHELLDLCRSDHRWRDAKACCLDTTGGLSITVLRAILTKWAVESAATGARRRATYRPRYYQRVEPRRRYESIRNDAPRYDLRYSDYGYDHPFYEEDDLRLVRTRPDYREVWTRPVDRNAYDRPAYDRPVYERPVYERPVYERPVYERPAYERPIDGYERDFVVRDTPANEPAATEASVGVSLPVSLI